MMKRDVPILFCFWIKEVPEKRVRDLVSKADTEGEISLAFPVTPADFEDAVRKWYSLSTNTQYLFITTHGVLGGDGRTVGIGYGKQYDYCIEWSDLWNLVVKAKHKPPNIHIMGCKVTDAVHTWNRLLTRRQNTPYFVGYNQIVDDAWKLRRIAKVLDKLLGFLRVSAPVVTLDEELSQVVGLGSDVDAYIPYCLKGQEAHFADVRKFEETYGMALKQYLDRRADELALGQRRMARPTLTSKHDESPATDGGSLSAPGSP